MQLFLYHILTKEGTSSTHMARTTVRWGEYGPSRNPDAEVDDRKTLSDVRRKTAEVKERLAQTMAQNFKALPTLIGDSKDTVETHGSLRNHTEFADSDSDVYEVGNAADTSSVSSDGVTDYYLDQLVSGRNVSYRRSADEFEKLSALTTPRKQM